MLVFLPEQQIAVNMRHVLYFREKDKGGHIVRFGTIGRNISPAEFMKLRDAATPMKSFVQLPQTNMWVNCKNIAAWSEETDKNGVYIYRLTFNAADSSKKNYSLLVNGDAYAMLNMMAQRTPELFS